MQQGLINEGLPLLGGGNIGGNVRPPGGFAFCLYLMFAGTHELQRLVVSLIDSLVPTTFFAHCLAFLWTWLSIFMIPMAKVNREAILLLSNPTNLEG